MEEYGGYIEFEYFNGSEYHKDAIALNTGRSCVEYLIMAKRIDRLYIPYFLCGSIKEICDRQGISVEYYHIDRQFMPICNKHFDNSEWLYIVNYYGQLSNDNIIDLKNRYGNIIIDNVQSFFQEPVHGIDTLYSCRKFFGVADGAYLYTDTMIEDKIEQDFSYNRMGFLFGRQEKTANEFYSQYLENNRLLGLEHIKKMSRLTKNLMKSIDYSSVKEKRTENFKYMHENLENINRLELSVPEGAFMYPFYISNGAEVRKKLQKEKIYIPTLWPDVFNVCSKSDLEYDMALNILPLPVDQRYTTDDMQYIIESVLENIN